MHYEYSNLISKELRSFTIFDGLILLLIFGFLSLMAWGSMAMAAPYALGEPLAISLSPSMLPYYATRTVIRMLLGMILSLIFTFTIGTLAAKSQRAERVIIPCVDVMQSIPVLGFLSISVVPFMLLFPNSLLGPECAAVFAVFTSQAWNMMLGFYQSLKSLPRELSDATAMLRLSAWQNFWHLKVPFAMPGLLWNSMVSMSAGWFFVVASEAITVSNQSIYLPGVGSYIRTALNQNDFWAMGYAVLAMFVVILSYDQLLFRPLLAWSARFQDVATDETSNSSWFLNGLQRATWIQAFWRLTRNLSEALPYRNRPRRSEPSFVESERWHSWSDRLSFFVWNIVTVALVLHALWAISTLVMAHVHWHEVWHVTVLGAYTALRVFVSVALSSIIWVPIGIWVSLRPGYALWLQTIAQFLASFPANLAYPFAFWCMLRYGLNLEWWSIPLMMLGTQWYILFNIIAGISTLSREQHWAVANLQLSGWLWWKRFALPAIFPHYITGAMAAAGGCWNASILAEMIESGGQRLSAHGLGAYIAQVTEDGDFSRIALSIGIMCLYVMIINHLVWQRLYRTAQERCLDG